MAKRERDGLFQRKGSRYWWVRTDPITGKAEPTGCLDREAARLWRANRERLHANPAYAAATQARLDDWMTNYIDTNRPNWSEATLAIAKEKLGHFVRLWGYERDGEWHTDVMLADIGPSSFDEFVKVRRGEGVHDHTVSKEVSALIRVLKLAKRAGCYAVDIDTLRPPDLSTSYEPRERALTREEVGLLCAELAPRYVAFVAICVALGVRRSEAFRIQPENVDLEAGRVVIYSAKVRKGSKKKTRVLPILSLGRGLVEAARTSPAGCLATRRASWSTRFTGGPGSKRSPNLPRSAWPEWCRYLLRFVTVRALFSRNQGDPSGNRTRVTGVRGRFSAQHVRTLGMITLR
jgi:integrase